MTASLVTPPSWVRTTLGEILLRIEAGRSFRCEARPAGDYEWGVIKVSAMTYGEFRERENKAISPGTPFHISNEIKPGDILLSRANTESYVGAPVLVGQCRSRLLLSDKSLRLVPVPSVDRNWLAYLLSSPGMRKEVSRRATGTKDSMRNISQASLREIEIGLPPLSEQRRIVAAVDGHLSHIETAARSVGSAKRNQQLLSRRLVDARLSSLGTETHALRSVLREPLINGKSVASDSNGFPVLRLTALRDGKLALSERKGGLWTAKDAAPYLVRKGDFFISRGNGSLSLVGRGALLEEEPDPVAFPDTMVRIRVDPQKMSAEFLRLVWGSRGVRRQIESSARTTAGIYKVNQRIIEEIRIPTPSIPMQERVVAQMDETLDSVSRVGGQIQQAAIHSDLLRRWLLTEAFAGRLVRQDPADEPASLLLGRIRAERSAGSPTRNRRSARKMKPRKEDRP